MTHPRYFVSIYTDGPAMRWNVIDRSTQEWVRRFSSENEANSYARKLGSEIEEVAPRRCNTDQCGAWGECLYCHAICGESCQALPPNDHREGT